MNDSPPTNPRDTLQRSTLQLDTHRVNDKEWEGMGVTNSLLFLLFLLLISLCCIQVLSENYSSISFRKTSIDSHTIKYEVIRADTIDTSISYQEALKLFVQDQYFRATFAQQLREVNMGSYYWECPPLSLSNSEKPFEFVLIEANLHKTRTNPKSFEKYVQNCANNVVSFKNLGGDASLVVPCPTLSGSTILNYGHLAAFLRNAPQDQIDALLVLVGKLGLKTLRKLNSGNRVWLSTSGGGVPWLHVRFDSRPKYYNYRPYKEDDWLVYI